MHVFKCVSVRIARQSEDFASFLIYMPLSKAKDGRMESGREIKERERSHRRRQDWRELKVEEEKEGPLRETVPVRLRCESQQGASSSRSAQCVCVCVCARLCFHVTRCWWLPRSGIYSWCVGLIPWRPSWCTTDSKSFSTAPFNLTHMAFKSLTKSQIHAQWVSCSVMVTAARGEPAGLWLSASLCHQKKQTNKHRAWQQRKDIKIQHNTRSYTAWTSELVLHKAWCHELFLIQYMAAWKQVGETSWMQRLQKI